MLQLDNNTSQRGPHLPNGSDITQTTPPTSIVFPSASLTNGNGLAASANYVHAHSALNGGPASFMGLSAGVPPAPSSHGLVGTHGPGRVPPPMGSMIHWGTGSPHHLAVQTNAPSALQQGAGSGVLSNTNIGNSNRSNIDNNNNSEDDDDDDYRPFTPPPPRERLSYTRYQLELLNGIYGEVRYPNSTQKQLIAKRVGITREQVKIWFQNRRRKDVVSKGGKSDGKETDNPSTTDTGDTNPNVDGSDNSNASTSRPDEAETEAGMNTESFTTNGNTNDNLSGRLSTGSNMKDDTDSSDSKDKMVSTVVLNSIIAELQKFNNEYLKQKKNRKKNKPKKNAATLAAAAAAAAAATNSPASSCKSKRLFQSYDMIAPPNKVTPTAFLNTSANRFKHAGGTSAFQNPREHRLMPIPGLNLGDNRLWDGFSLTNGPSFPGSVESSDLLPQRSPVDPTSAIPAIPSSLASSFGIQNHQTPHQQAAAFSGLLAGSMAAAHHLNSQTSLYDNLPVLSDLLNSYKNQQSASAVAAAHAAVAHRQHQLEQSLLSSTSGSPGRPQPPSQSFFHLPGGAHHSSTGSLGSSGGSSSAPSSTNATNNSTSDDSSKSPLSDLTFPSPTAPPTHPFPFSPAHHHHHAHPHSHPHSSAFALNRVFPFPLIADPPVMLSTIRQSDSTFRPHPPHQWPHPPTSLGQTASPVGVGQTLGSSQLSPPTSEDPYRPLLISSLNNPYFSPSSSTNYPSFSPTSLPPPPQHSWPTSSPGTDSTEFAQI